MSETNSGASQGERNYLRKNTLITIGGFALANLGALTLIFSLVGDRIDKAVDQYINKGTNQVKLFEERMKKLDTDFINATLSLSKKEVHIKDMENKIKDIEETIKEKSRSIDERILAISSEIKIRGEEVKSQFEKERENINNVITYANRELGKATQTINNEQKHVESIVRESKELEKLITQFNTHEFKQKIELLVATLKQGEFAEQFISMRNKVGELESGRISRIVSKSIFLQNGAGQEVINLTTDKDGHGVLNTYSSSGKQITSLGVGNDGYGGLRIFNKDGQERVRATGGTGGGLLELKSQTAQTVVSLSTTTGGAGVATINSNNGKLLAHLGGNASKVTLCL